MKTETEKFTEKLLGDGNGCGIWRLAIKSLKQKGFKFTPHYLNEYEVDYTHHIPDIMEEARLILNAMIGQGFKAKDPEEARETVINFNGFIKGFTDYEK